MKETKDFRMMTGIIGWTLGMVLFLAFMSAINLSLKNSYNKIWIDSPSGKHYELPSKLALRIIRKHKWELTKVEPIMTRWQHFKAVFSKQDERLAI